MTCIAYRSGIMAVDSAATSNGTVTGSSTKIARNKKGDLAGASGDAIYNYAFRQWFLKGEKGKPPDATESGAPASSNKGLIVRRKGTIEVYEFKGKHVMEANYYAMGSGRDHALGAMFVGASAIQAVEAAIAHDTYCGGKIVSLKHEP